MPVLHFHVNLLLDAEQKSKILADASRLVSMIMNKPLADVMVVYSFDDIVLGGHVGLAAFVELKCLSGLTPDISRSLCEGLLKLLQEVTGLEASRIYFNFFPVRCEHAWRFKNDHAVCAG